MKFVLLTITLISLDLYCSNIELTFERVAQTNPEVKQSLENKKIAKQQIKNAWADFKPKLTANYSRGRKSEKYGGLGGNYDINEFDLTLSQPIFNGLKDFYNLRRQYINQEATKISVNNQVQSILLRAAIAHIQYATERMIFSIAKQNEQAHRTHFFKTKTKQEHGVMTKADLRLAQARLANSSADKETSEINLYQARQNYIEIAGQDEEVQLPELRELEHKTEKDFIDQALSDNLSLQRSKANVSISNLRIKESRSSYFPTISIQGQYQNDKTFSPFRDTNGNVLSASINISMPLYDGGRRYSQINQTISERVQSQHGLALSKRNVLNRAKSTWFNLSKAKQIMLLRERATSRSKDTFLSFLEQHQSGIRETQDLLDAQRELFNNQIQEARAKQNLLVSYYRALFLLGKIN